jgi:hypothetical protein
MVSRSGLPSLEEFGRIIDWQKLPLRIRLALLHIRTQSDTGRFINSAKEPAVEGQKTPEQLLAEQQARQEISRRYLDPRANDAEYQDLVDRNRILSGKQVAPKSALQPPGPAEESGVVAAVSDALSAWIKERPTGGVLTAAATGFVIALALFR